MLRETRSLAVKTTVGQLLPQGGSMDTERFRGGRYWSGDLAYRDAEGWFYFAGRSNEWLRVDGENFAAGVVESIIGRFEAARTAVISTRLPITRDSPVAR